MDLSAELRYYEIRFIKLINSFHRVYKLDKLLTFLEMLTFISEGNLTHVQAAMQRVITNDPKIRIYREEYIVTLKLFSGFNNTEIRKIARCSPNTILNAMNTYEQGDLYIHPKFELEQSNEIRNLIKHLIEISNIH